MSNPYLSILIFLGVGVGFVLVPFVLSYLITAHKSSPVQEMSYECGEEPIGQAWIQYNVRYYIFALIFVIFDVEVAFMIPWAVVFNQMRAAAFAEMGVFLVILLFGLAYVWKKGDLKWY